MSIISDIMMTPVGSGGSSPIAAAGLGFESASSPYGTSLTAPGDTYRGIGSSLFNQGNIAAEDFTRGEVSADNALTRQLYALQKEQEFNLNEAQKAFDRQVDFAKNSYGYAVESMKKAGLNPVLAYQQGALSTPSSSSATSSGDRVGSSSYRPSYSRDPLVDVLSGVTKIVSGLVAAL